nr:MAG TPA: hypothetical protein [Microviridae sp.]
MDRFDAPKVCPLIGYSRPLSWSVGCYRGRKRCVIAWFEHESDALDYARRTSEDYPDWHIDVLRSMF